MRKLPLIILLGFLLGACSSPTEHIEFMPGVPMGTPFSELTANIAATIGMENISNVEAFGNKAYFAITRDGDTNYFVADLKGDTVYCITTAVPHGYQLDEQITPAGSITLFEDQDSSLIVWRDSTIKQ